MLRAPTTDHGIEMPRAKWFLFDPGIAIAMVVRHPRAGLVGGRVCGGLLSNVDYAPTILDLADVGIPGHMQGRSFADALRPGNVEAGREAVFAMHHRSQARCVRTDRYKLIRHFDPATDFSAVPVRYEDVMMRRGIPLLGLYDLRSDPLETANLAGQKSVAGVQADLERRLWTWMESVNDPLLAGPVPSPSYRAAMSDYTAWKAAGR